MTGSVESVGIPHVAPIRLPSGIRPPKRPPSLASPLASVHDIMAGLTSWMADALAITVSGPRTMGIDVGSETGPTAFDSYWALSVVPRFTPFPVHDSLRKQPYHLVTPSTRTLERSRVEIRPRAPGIRLATSGHEYVAMPASIALPCQTSSHKVRRIL